jgi:hypothetical protein
MAVRLCGALLVTSLLMMGCITRYEAATVSTLTPKSRVTLLDNTKVKVEQPDVRSNTLIGRVCQPVDRNGRSNCSTRSIPLDSIAKFERDDGSKKTLGTVAAVIIGLGLGGWLSTQMDK